MTQTTGNYPGRRCAPRLVPVGLPGESARLQRVTMRTFIMQQLRPEELVP